MNIAAATGKAEWGCVWRGIGVRLGMAATARWSGVALRRMGMVGDGRDGEAEWGRRAAARHGEVATGKAEWGDIFLEKRDREDVEVSGQACWASSAGAGPGRQHVQTDRRPRLSISESLGD